MDLLVIFGVIAVILLFCLVVSDSVVGIAVSAILFVLAAAAFSAIVGALFYSPWEGASPGALVGLVAGTLIVVIKVFARKNRRS